AASPQHGSFLSSSIVDRLPTFGTPEVTAILKEQSQICMTVKRSNGLDKHQGVVAIDRRIPERLGGQYESLSACAIELRPPFIPRLCCIGRIALRRGHNRANGGEQQRANPRCAHSRDRDHVWRSNKGDLAHAVLVAHLLVQLAPGRLVAIAKMG